MNSQIETQVTHPNVANGVARSGPNRRSRRGVAAFLATVMIAVGVSTAFATPAAAAQQYCYSNSMTSQNTAYAGNIIHSVTDNVTVCMRWNYSVGQYRISSWTSNPTYRAGIGWELVDWSGTQRTGGNGHLAFNSYVRANFKSCLGIWIASGCVQHRYNTTQISFQITNAWTGAARWVTDYGPR